MSDDHVTVNGSATIVAPDHLRETLRESSELIEGTDGDRALREMQLEGLPPNTAAAVSEPRTGARRIVNLVLVLSVVSTLVHHARSAYRPCLVPTSRLRTMASP